MPLQCVIAPGSTHTYKFQALNQYGTFWTHDHTKTSYGDGILWPFVVHGRNEPYKRSRDYDEEVMVVLQDCKLKLMLEPPVHTLTV